MERRIPHHFPITTMLVGARRIGRLHGTREYSTGIMMMAASWLYYWRLFPPVCLGVDDSLPTTAATDDNVPRHARHFFCVVVCYAWRGRTRIHRVDEIEHTMLAIVTRRVLTTNVSVRRCMSSSIPSTMKVRGNCCCYCCAAILVDTI